MDTENLTREQHILLWKIEGGNYSWARWAKMHGLPEHNPAFIEELKQAGKAKNNNGQH